MVPRSVAASVFSCCFVFALSSSNLAANRSTMQTSNCCLPLDLGNVVSDGHSKNKQNARCLLTVVVLNVTDDVQCEF